MSGRNVTIPMEVNKVVCIGCTSLRFVTYLNCSDKVVGVETFERNANPGARSYAQSHKAYQNLPDIGPMDMGDKEQILRADPDPIFWTSYQAGDADDLYNSLKIPVVSLTNKMNLVEWVDIFNKQLRLMGEILDEGARAESIIQYVNDFKEDIVQRTADLTEDEVNATAYYCGISSSGGHGIDFTTSGYVPFVFANITNIIKPVDTKGNSRACQIDIETIISRNPRYVFVDWNGYSLVKEDYKKYQSSFDSIDAFKNGQLYGVLPMVSYSINYETLLADVYYVGKVVYPDRFADIDPEQKAHEIYTFWLGKSVYGDIIDVFGGGGFQQISLK